MLAYDWTFGSVLWAMVVFFFWFMLIWMFIGVFADIFRRNDLSGWGKAGWILLIFIFSVTLITLYIPVSDLGSSFTLSNDVASVGSQSVSAREFQVAYKNYLERMRSQLSPEMLRAFRFDRQILDALISRHVMMEEAKRLGIVDEVVSVNRKSLKSAEERRDR